MKIRDAIEWFQTAFDKELQAAVSGTPFDLDLLTAIAYQETGYIWQVLIEKGLKKADVLRLCVGDTIDASGGRGAFPKTKADLVAESRGDEMFAIARRSLEEMAKHIRGYDGVVAKPNKFCHGFGIFQYDLQFYKNDPDFFLGEKWGSAGECFGRLIAELFAAKRRQGWNSKQTLTDLEKVFVAIAYNRGTADPAKGLKQGHKNDEGKYYGELVSAYYDIAKSIPFDPGTAVGGGPGMNLTRKAAFVPLVGDQAPPPYPRHLIVRDSEDTASVKRIQQRLQDLGYTQPGKTGGTEPLGADGLFGQDTADAVELFQVRHTDAHGAPLTVDGEVGPETWAALFGAVTLHVSKSRGGDSPILDAVLDVASEEVGVLEEPPGSNRGKRVQEFQRTVGVSPGDPWCVAFVYWCFKQAAEEAKINNPMEKECRTGGVLDLWNRARGAKNVAAVGTDQALDDPSLLKPGMVFIISTGGGHGHTGLVSRVVGDRLETIEGNTNDGGSREGIGVFRRNGRSIASINRGFIDFSGAV